MRSPTTRNMESNVGGFRSIDGSEGHGGASSDASDLEPLGGISRIEDLDHDKGDSLGEKSGCSLQQGTKTSADSIASASSGAIFKEI